MSRSLGTLTLDMLVNLTGFKRGMKDAEAQSYASSQKMVKNLDSISQASHDLGQSFGRLINISGSLTSLLSTRAIANYADSFTQLNNQLKLVTQNEQELQTALKDTFKIAQETASTWSGVNEIYSKFAGISQQVGISQKQVASITQTVAKAVGMSGASAASADAALMQFGQALNTGVLRGAELNSVMSQTPALAKALADGMGVAVGELKILGEEGKITTEAMINALQRVAPQIETEYAKTATTISDSLNRIQNQFMKMVGETDKAFGVSDKIVAAISTVSAEMDRLMFVAGAIATVMAGRYVASMVQATQAVWAKVQVMRQEQLLHVEQLGKIALQEKAELSLMATKLRQAQVNKMVAGSQNAVSIATQQLTSAQIAYELQLKKSTAATLNYATAQRQATVSTTAFNAAKSTLLGLFGGPVGLIATIGMLVGGYALLRQSSKDTTAELDLQGKSVAELVEQYHQLEEHQKRQAMRELTKQIKEAREEHKLAVIDLSVYVDWLEESGLVSAKTAQQIEKLRQEYRDGQISLEQYGTQLNELVGISDKFKVKLDEKIDRLSQAKQALQLKNDVLNGYNSTAQQAKHRSQAFNNALLDTANHAKEAKSQLESLNHEAKNYLNSLNSAQKLAYVQTNMQYGWSQDKASFMFEARKKLGIPDHERLSDELKARLEKEFESAQKLSAMSRVSRVKSTPVRKSPVLKSQKTVEDFEKKRQQSRNEIVQYYTSDYQKIISHEAEQLQKLAEAGFASADQAKYQALIKQRFAYEQAEYLKQLNLQINLYRWSEREKLDYRYQMDQELIQNDIRLHNDVKQVKLKSLHDQYQYELAQIQLGQQQRYHQVSQFLHSEQQLLKQRYALERAEIALTLDEQERSRLMAISKAQELYDLTERQQQAQRAFAQIVAQMNVKEYENPLEMSRYQRTQALDDKYSADVDLSLYREQENLAQLQQLKEQQLISEALFEQQKTQIMRQAILEREQLYADYALQYRNIEQAYHAESVQSYLNYAQQVQGAMVGLVANIAGESSRSYKTMFAMQKAFAISQASINVYKAASDAWADPSATTIYQKMANAAVAITQSSSFIPLINAINPKGFASGGYTGNMGRNQVAGVVHGQEYVLNAQATQRIGIENLNRLNRGETLKGDTIVHVNVAVNADGSSTIDSNEQLGQAMGEAIKTAVLKIIQQEKRQGGMLA